MAHKTRKIVFSALLASLTCVATMLIQIPTPMRGYVNLGDCVVLLSAWVLGPFWGFLSAGIGSAMADMFLSYTTYAPATFVIKGLMAFVAVMLYRVLESKRHPLLALIASALVAEIIMIAGYYVFEGLLYGFGGSLVNVPANALQGLVGAICGIVLYKLIGKHLPLSDK